MKIVINYDLLEKIQEAKRGFSLVKSAKNSAKINAFVYGLNIAVMVPTLDSISLANWLSGLLFVVPVNIGLITAVDAFFDYGFLGKEKALYELSTLSKKLATLNIDTNTDLLLEASKYHTDYEVKSGDRMLPYVVQKKYFDIPTFDEKKEASVCQEHVIGSKIYTLSKGRFSRQPALQFAHTHS